MFPLRDSVPTIKRPIITYFLILVNVLVFLLELSAPSQDLFIERYALVGAKINFLSLRSLWPLISFQFLHGGFFHLLSNMWFLKIFGDNVEERLGRLRFLGFYLLCGVISGLSQNIFSMNSAVPMIGASGSIAGVLGAYFVFFPRHQIETLVPGPLFWYRVKLPASLMLLYWFVIQLFSGFGSLTSSGAGGVAFFAHAGGFLAGWLMAKREAAVKR